MTLKIIGAGFGRTGTMSMKLALEQLGFGPCHHMEEVLQNREKHLPLWHDAAFGKPVDWNKAYAGYRSAVDWPTAAYWPTLADHFPDAKILLTTRSAESWVKSIKATIFQTLENPPPNPDPYDIMFGAMIEKMIKETTFGGDITNDDHLMQVFNANVAAVQASFPGDRLLVYTIGDGWEPLCAWLGVPVPDTPYPRTNNKEEFFTLLEELAQKNHQPGDSPPNT
ncbi:sulfotransferase family protein [Kordiimonas sediminis]|uniref:Sulfotransferase family protein n=1 Tax=Kordiimonas sediminis TaxID=1735581 RepID=A0A919E428_9PROT|nr:sulfotransferase family protein [Kordiimonas sediminis]GHF17681.1 sulfotransferase family protein [Kordiimonas sediminis]